MEITSLLGYQQLDEFRKKIFDMAIETQNYHIASAFSCADIVSVLYDKVITKNDKFIMSKGHGCLSLYVALQEKGYKPDIYKQHPDIDINNGIECTTGSLGHGLPVGVGMALAKKLKNEDGVVYVLIGDGECQEGTIWESLLLASHHKLDNLCIIVDKNRLQALGKTEDILALGNLKDKFKEFGANIITLNGHNKKGLQMALKVGGYNKPKCVIANAIKGKGMKCMENIPKWHNRMPTKEEIELEENLQK